MILTYSNDYLELASDAVTGNLASNSDGVDAVVHVVLALVADAVELAGDQGTGGAGGVGEVVAAVD